MSHPWREIITSQLDFYWEVHLWPRLQGLTDEEYFWEPVAGCWSLRRDGAGAYRLDEAPEADPSPVTTIAWRLVHVGAYNIGTRVSAFFGDDAIDGDMFDHRHRPAVLPATAADALALLTGAYHRWSAGLAGLSDEEFSRPLGVRGGPFAEDSMAGLALHVSRETMHHGGEICLLRDLYAAERR